MTMPTRKSARLQEKTDGDENNIFVVDNEDAPSLNGEIIEKNDHWITVWSKLKKAGWGWKQGNAISSYFYTKPNINSIKDKRKDIDYFVKEEHVKKYVEVKYNWSQHQNHNFAADVEDEFSVKNDETQNDEKKTSNKRRIFNCAERDSTEQNRKKNQKLQNIRKISRERKQLKAIPSFTLKQKSMTIWIWIMKMINRFLIHRLFL